MPRVPLAEPDHSGAYFDGKMPLRSKSRAWAGIDNGAVVRVTHSVTRTEMPRGEVFLAWRWDTEPATLIGKFDSAEEARHCCELDA